MATCEAVERSQEITGKVSAATLLACVRFGSDSLYVHARAVHDRPSYSDAFVFKVSACQKMGPARVETTQTLDVPGRVGNGQTSHRKDHENSESGRWVTYDETYRPEAGFWSLSYTGRDRLIDVLELLPRDAEVSFEIALDNGTNEYLIRAECPMNYGTQNGLHSDHFFLVVEYAARGKRKVRRYLIDTSCVAHNSARFGGPR
jgi:hypothetical protein